LNSRLVAFVVIHFRVELNLLFLKICYQRVFLWNQLI